MANLTDEKDTHFTLMLWGPYKTGKTVLASQFPNPHFVTLDPQALMSVRGLKNKYELDFDLKTININDDKTEDPEFLELVKSKAFVKQPAWIKMKKLIGAWISTLDENSTLVLDNLSRAGEILRNYVTPEGKVKLGWDEWNLFISEIESLKEILYKGGRRCLVIIIAHEEVKHDDMTEEKKRYIYLPTRERHRLPSLVTDHIYMYNEIKGPRASRKITRKLQSIPDNDTDTGSRALIPNIDFPTFNKMKPYFEAALGRTLPEATWTPPVDE